MSQAFLSSLLMVAASLLACSNSTSVSLSESDVYVFLAAALAALLMRVVAGDGLAGEVTGDVSGVCMGDVTGVSMSETLSFTDTPKPE